MKKTLIILALTAISLVSCNKEIIDITANDNSGLETVPATNIVFNLTANHPDGTATKAVKTGWEKGDVLYVFFNNIAAPKYLKMSYDGNKWTYTQMNGASEESLGLVEDATGMMRAVYLPFGNTLTVGADGTSFTFSTTTYSYYMTATLAYTVEGGEVSGAFDMAIPDGYIQFFLDDECADPSTEIELREPLLTPQGIASIAADGTITHTNVAHGAPLPGYVYDKTVKTGSDSKGYLFSGILAAEARNTSTNYHFTLVCDGWDGDYYAKAFLGKTWYRSDTEGRALKMPALSGWTTITDYKPIDLGCDVGGKRIYWSSRNLGASRDYPAEDTEEARKATFGDYYAWGELEPYYVEGHAYDEDIPGGSEYWKAGKTWGYAWSSYSFTDQYCHNIYKYNTSKTYGSIDNKTVLELADDVAAHVLGGLWRIPTEDELAALISATDYDWDSNTATVKGGTSMTDPTIYLPTATCRNSTSWSTPLTEGRYWSSSLVTDAPPSAHFLSIRSHTEPPIIEITAYFRYLGLSIRPVSE